MKTAKDYQKLVNDAIKNLSLPESPKRLYQPIHYAMSGSGKRIRPVLLLAAADAVGADIHKALPAALAVEMFHNFTLVHDDMMDRSPLRRGQPTVYKRWNESVAILSGDAMLTTSNILLSETQSDNLAKMTTLFNQTAMLVYEGQQLDMDFEERRDVTAEEYMKMIGLKTSVLLGCAASIGAMFGADDKTSSALYDFGYNLGIAFQLQDDFLDTFGTQADFGKPIGGDIVNRKKTWLLINAINQMPEKVEEIYDTETLPEKLVKQMKTLYFDLGLDEQCNELIGCFTALAERSLNDSGLSDKTKDFFRSFARSLLKRSK